MKHVLLFAAAALVITASASAQDRVPVRAPGIHDELLAQANGPTIHYAISVPKGYHGEPVPLILALHFGGDPQGAGRAMLEILIQPALGELGAVIIAPDSLGGGWSTAVNEKGVKGLLAAVEKSYALDQKKVVVTGFSMSGQGTWYWADRYPERFNAAVPISGTPTPSAATWRQPELAVHSRDDHVQPIGPTDQRMPEVKKAGI